MLKTIDRIQIATLDARAAATAWVELLGAEIASTDAVRALGAKRTTCRIGRGFVEFLEPDGAGAIEVALGRVGRAHLFAGGASIPDFGAAVKTLRGRGVEIAEAKGQAFLNAKPFLGVESPFVLSPHEDRPRVGLIDFLYEVTLLAHDPQGVVARFAELFSLDASHFVPIASDKFGYDGVLTLFSKDDLHRFEVIHPTTNTTTMGRYFEKQGESYYMCFAESPDMVEIERRVLARGAGITVDRPAGRAADASPDQMWVHPPALGGVMLGVSRPTMAWTWSGHPERVRAFS